MNKMMINNQCIHFLENEERLTIFFESETKHDSLLFFVCLIPLSLHTSSMMVSILGRAERSAVGNK